ncbi:MAG TPA: hypothetical protein VM940_09900 [Chthoniobacterales bacterium]|jgi:hypothetical protein|nr:hypothetical protein [Chthoniobacterales bacterium]
MLDACGNDWKAFAVFHGAKRLTALSVCWLLSAFPLAADDARPPAQQNQPPAEGVKVVILGDSLALCGFGQRLDQRFRKSPHVNATFTYIACGTNPLSWLKERPYSRIQTHCGYVSIESDSGSGRVKEVLDVYGQRRGHTPGSHTVPKLEDLLASLQPDILIMQTGTNLFDLFPDHKTVNPGRHGPALRSYLAPFIAKATTIPSNLRKVYWVASPTSGRVSKEIQDFVLQQTRAEIGHVAEVIDSRTLVAYPYRHMEPDKEHFLGAEMDQWADGVFDIVERDLANQAIASLKPLSQTALAHGPKNEPTPPAEQPKDKTIEIRAKLVAKTQPVPVKEFLPYQEFLVGYLYDVVRVVAGEYSEKQILVMHPAYIKLDEQRLGRWRIGRTYRLHLRELENTVWKTVKSKDDSGLINLQPYIRVQDERRHPEHAR